MEHYNYIFPLALADLDMASTPGFCSLNRFGTTNGQILGWDGASFNEERVDYLQRCVWDRLYHLNQGREWSDPIKLFIKHEPHKVSKLDEGRLRLISSVSLIDAMVDRVLFMPLAALVKKNFLKTRMMVGWSPLKGGYRSIAFEFDGRKVLAIDKSSWDWTMPYWLIDLCMQLILSLAVDYPDWWRDLVKLRFKLLFVNPIFKFADGLEVMQPFPGIMKSGCYLTIILNSMAQFLLHSIVCYSIKLDPNEGSFFAMGDDTAQDEMERLDEYLRKMESFGFKVKYHSSDVVEFAGFHLTVDKYIPAYRNKHLFQLEYLTREKDVAVSTLRSYQLLYFFDPGFLKIINSIIIDRGLYEAHLSCFALTALAKGV